MVQKLVVSGVDEKLSRGRVGSLCARHGQGVLVVFQAVVSFVLNGRVTLLLFHVGVKAATLHHEARNDSVEDGVVVVTFFDVMQKVFSAQGRFFGIQFNKDDAFAGDMEFDLRIAHAYCTKVID